MTDQAVHASEFLNRPQARKGPDVPYKNDAGSNPVLRGFPLAAVSKMYAWAVHVVVNALSSL